MLRGGQRVRARGRCVGAARKSERIKCAWAGAGACARRRCALGGGAASASGRAQPRAGAHGRQSKEGCVRELFARPASPGCGVRRGCPPPPAPSARPTPTSASRLFLVPDSQGRRSPRSPAGIAPPGRRCSLPRPRRRLSGALPVSQRGAGAAGRGARVGLRCGGPGPRSTGTRGALLRPPRLRPRAGPLLGNSLPLASSGAGGAGAEGVLHFPGSCLGLSSPSPNLHSSQYLWSRKQLPSTRSQLRGPWWAISSTG